MAAVGGVDEEEGDALLLLLRQLLGPEAPEIAQCQVPHPAEAAVGAAEAALPQEEGAAEGPAVLRLVKGGGVLGAVLIAEGQVALLPALGLGPEADGGDGLALALGLVGHEALPDAGGRHAVADKIAGGEVFGPRTQEAVEAVHLAGGAGEEDGPGLEDLPDLPEGAAKVALDILGAPELREILRPEGGGMAEVEGIVKGGAEDHAAGAEGILRQGGEDAAGGGGQADGVVLHPGGVGRREDAVRCSRMQDGAGGAAAAALDALFTVHHRDIEALPVPAHGDGVPGADGGAGAAAGAAAALRQLGDGGLLPFFRLVGLVFQGAAEVRQGIPAGMLQFFLDGIPVDGVLSPGAVALADDAALQAQAAQEGVGPGELRGLPLRGGGGGEEGLAELDGEDRAVEGVGADEAGPPEEAQKLGGSGVQHQPGPRHHRAADAAELDHGKAGLPRQGLDVGDQGVRAADAVAEDVAPGEAGVLGDGAPILPPEEEGGVQDHGDGLARELPEDGLALGLPHGDVGEGGEVAPELVLHAVRDPGDAEGGGVGDLPPRREGAEEDGIEAVIREDGGVPDLIAAGEVDIVGEVRRLQLLKAPVAVRRQAELPGLEGVKALLAAL